MSWILSLQAYCEVQDNFSSIHATEQKILALSHRDYKISSNLLQQSHGNIKKSWTVTNLGRDPPPPPLPYGAQNNPPSLLVHPFPQARMDPSIVCFPPPFTCKYLSGTAGVATV